MHHYGSSLFLSIFLSALLSPITSLLVRRHDVDLIQRFDHPNITELSPVDEEPFQPPGDRDRGFLGIRVLCKCGLQNNGSRSRPVATQKLELEDDPLGEKTPHNLTQNLRLVSSTKVSLGTEAEVNEYPWIVALVYNLGNGTKVHFCGGTLFSSRYILTATHCLEGKTPEKTEIWLNQHDILLKQGDTLQIRAERFIVHPNYNPIMHYNDISIIQLAEEVDIVRESYRPICLPPTVSYEPLESPGTASGIAAGWGQIYYSGPKSDKLLKVSLPILTNGDCLAKSEPFYRRRVKDHMICAGDIQMGGRDTCPGDSGGPLFVNDVGKHILVGIVSWGYRCGEPRRPGVYTRVSKYLGWINMEASRGGQRCAG